MTRRRFGGPSKREEMLLVDQEGVCADGVRFLLPSLMESTLVLGVGAKVSIWESGVRSLPSWTEGTTMEVL